MLLGQFTPSMLCGLVYAYTTIEVAGAYIFRRLQPGKHWSGLGPRKWIRLVACKYLTILLILWFFVTESLGIMP